jgi:phosphatidylinositol alpha-1,6-mannosyltransferase
MMLDVVVVAPPHHDAKKYDDLRPWKTIRTTMLGVLWPHWLKLFFTLSRLVRSEGATEIWLHHVLPVGYVAHLLKWRRIITNYTVFLHGTDVVLAQASNRKKKWFVKICRGAKQVVVNSEFLKTQVVAMLGSESNVVVLNPAPADFFMTPVSEAEKSSTRAQLALDGGKQVLLTVARFIPSKGVATLVGLLPRVLAQVPNAVLLLVGAGPEKDTILATIQANNLQNSVRMLGEVPAELLPRLYQTADIFVLLTQTINGYGEAWGTVFLEAGVSGLPVVAGRSGGVSEAVHEGVTGDLVEVNNPEQVVQSIVCMLTNPEKAREMGAASRARVLAEFTWEKQLTKLSQ